MDNCVKIESKKTINDLEKICTNCTECKICLEKCVMLKYICKSPKELCKNILEKREVNYKIPYSCSMCNLCEKVCPNNLNLMNIFMEMRQEIALKNKGLSPLKGHKAIHMHQKFSFYKMFSGVVVDEKYDSVKRVFIPGCSLCAYNPDLVFKTFEYLKRKLPGTALLIHCCGKPTFMLGEKDLFRRRYLKLENVINSLGTDEVITACQSCFLTITKNSPQYKVKSLWNVLREIDIPEEAKGIGNGSDLIFSIFDSCPTRYRKDIQDSIRILIKRMGYKFRELKSSRENTRCCGMGGMIYSVNLEVSQKITMETINESQYDYFVSYCASCRNSIAGQGKKSFHILDLIFHDKWTTKSEAPKNVNVITSWLNRYKVKRGKNSYE